MTPLNAGCDVGTGIVKMTSDEENITALTDMCRLCLSTENLVWVFDKRFENSESMKVAIYVTTGIEILTTDGISQKICEKCCHIIIKIVEFKKMSHKNDRILKEKLKKIKEAKLTQTVTLAPPPDVQIKQEKPDAFAQPQQVLVKSAPIHSTVQQLYLRYPDIKLPRMCLSCDIRPMVELELDQVENYFKRHKLNFEEHCKLILKPRNTVRKRTVGKPKPIPDSPNSINWQIVPQEAPIQPIKLKMVTKTSTGGNVANESKGTVNRDESQTLRQEVEKTVVCHKRKLSFEEHLPVKENENSEEEIKRQCRICDKIVSDKHFKKHRLKHLRCPFCKTTFRTLEDKNDHIKNNCPINISIKVPNIEVKKVETDVEVVKKYVDAFTDFPSVVSALDLNRSETLTISSDSEPESAAKPDPTPETAIKTDDKKIPAQKTIEIIEIISDDDSANPPPAKVPKVNPVIKPDVNIKDNDALQIIGPNSNEIEALRKLLTHYTLLNVSVEKSVQTESPNSKAIEVDKLKHVAVFTDLKSHLYVYRIPIEIGKGSFNASYSQRTENSKHQNLRLWNDLTLVDIKQNNTKVLVTAQKSTAVSNLVSTTTRMTSTARPTEPTKHTQPVTSTSPWGNNYNLASNQRPPVIVEQAKTHLSLSTVGPSAISALSSVIAYTNTSMTSTPVNTSLINSTSIPKSDATNIRNSSVDSGTYLTPKGLEIVPSTSCLSAIPQERVDRPNSVSILPFHPETVTSTANSEELVTGILSPSSANPPTWPNLFAALKNPSVTESTNVLETNRHGSSASTSQPDTTKVKSLYQVLKTYRRSATPAVPNTLTAPIYYPPTNRLQSQQPEPVTASVLTNSNYSAPLAISNQSKSVIDNSSNNWSGVRRYSAGYSNVPVMVAGKRNTFGTESNNYFAVPRAVAPRPRKIPRKPSTDQRSIQKEVGKNLRPEPPSYPYPAHISGNLQHPPSSVAVGTPTSYYQNIDMVGRYPLNPTSVSSASSVAPTAGVISNSVQSSPITSRPAFVDYSQTLVNNNYNQFVPVTNFSPNMVSLPYTSTPCSTPATTPQIGHIRVKNMKELT
ncbi:hypothetical protein NQ315_007293 [Exocentrus adspersus]|uniref:ZAD domain-containing protein n=1 Tax=Exocentrus adspersus TaxID=1586481 RepID=A0AAV8WDI1_9CUCU|nr:hypothetical protein NQ315_007293 [Exocentrus adspersus]